MTLDPLIQLGPYTVSAWKADIAPCAHAAAGVKRIPGSHNILCWVEGTADPARKMYPGTLFKPGVNGASAARPVYINSGHVSLSVAFTVDQDALDNGNVLETDLILIIDGYKYNLSGQRHIRDGRIDIGNWTDTTLRAGSLAPGLLYVATWAYRFDALKKTCSVVSYGDGRYLGQVPAALGNMPATPTNWAELPAVPGQTVKGAAYLQLPQMGSMPAGGNWQVRIGDCTLRWW